MKKVVFKKDGTIQLNLENETKVFTNVADIVNYLHANDIKIMLEDCETEK